MPHSKAKEKKKLGKPRNPPQKQHSDNPKQKKRPLDKSILPKKRKAKNARTKRIVESQEPQMVELVKTCMFIVGHTSTTQIRDVLQDLSSLKKPDHIPYTTKKQNNFFPFDNIEPLQKLEKKSFAPLFVLSSDSNKRPMNLVLGRFFEHQLLDMIEVGVENFLPISHFGNGPQLGNKPCFVFDGPEFKENEDYRLFSNLLLDTFRGEEAKGVDLAHLEHVIVCTSGPDKKIFFRVYQPNLKKAGTAKTPRVELEEMGPRIDFVIRRSRLANPDLQKESFKVPKALTPVKKKNISEDIFGKKGLLHMGTQDLSTMKIRKSKALKNADKIKKKKKI